MAIESFYFSHDYSARADRKLIALQMNMGMQGVGIFWCIVEMLYEEAGYIMLSECERIAFELRTDKDRIIKVLNEFDLFKNDGVKFWSESVLKRLDKRYEKSEKARKSAEKRWNNANALRTQSEGNAIKERKGKERKDNKGNKDFNLFWELYDYKKEKPKTEKIWNKLSDQDRESILKAVKDYVKSTPDKKFRKHPATYLNQRCWEDEVIDSNLPNNLGGRESLPTWI